ncbi:Hydroxymethylglutaryl-CoA lyase, mitochondrial [Erysiphe neolycopersici]|uniref:hydroxymethylglutaryl-CoA lyase n=1 Tax=Erysiphe neolycopersici TaxID=212602 RepID=A0A420HUH7_9PEZI|nr:Hydroxymethylglutaryl-CoA lyase, mitochondrial [Erysiphe neolycopersici]
MSLLTLSLKTRCNYSPLVKVQRLVISQQPSFTPFRFYATEKFVKITDVSPRDGLQNENTMIPLHLKLQLIKRLASTGIKSIETGSFVSHKWVPQMADSDQILRHLILERSNKTEKRTIHPIYSFLVPNIHGFNILYSQLQAHNSSSTVNTTTTTTTLDFPPIEINIFVSATESFSRKNLNCSIKESMDRARLVVNAAKAANLRIRAYISVALGCPFEGHVSASNVASLAVDLLEMGASDIALGDTTGMGTKPTTLCLLKTLKAAGIESNVLSMHLHDTYGMSIANMILGLEHGIRSFDGSVAGLGGCPYSPGATGNVGTEDIVYLCNSLGLDTNIDLESLVKVGQWASHSIGKRNGSRVGNALTQKIK